MNPEQYKKLSQTTAAPDFEEENEFLETVREALDGIRHHAIQTSRWEQSDKKSLDYMPSSSGRLGFVVPIVARSRTPGMLNRVAKYFVELGWTEVELVDGVPHPLTSTGLYFRYAPAKPTPR